MRSVMSALVMIVWAWWSPAAAQDRAAIWLEAESAQIAGADLQPQAPRAEVLSGGRWMQHASGRDAAPAGGVTFAHAFTATGGAFDVWARVGFEWVRADLAWRVDGGAWTSVPASTPTTNPVELAVWTEAAWLKCGAVGLSDGPHTLEVRFTVPEGNDRFLFGYDCVALVPAGAAWTPDGVLKPGESYDAAIDREAAARVHALPSPAADGARIELALDGPWQVARFDDPDMDVNAYEPVKALPAAADYALQWRGIAVPSDAWTARPELSFGHRLIYRTRVDAPADLRGRSFLLRLDGHAWITSVFVNGRFAGARQHVMVPLDIDITPYVEAGATNTIDLVIKGSYYAIDHQPGQLKRSRNQPRNEEFLRHVKWVDATWPTGKGGGEAIHTGLTRAVSLVVAGPAYTSDVFVRSNVGAMRLDADIELTNTSERAQALTLRVEAVHDRTGEVERVFPDRAVEIAAGGTAAVTVSEPWPDAKLWWPAESIDDRPDCYRLRVTLLASGSPIDARETLFGFRELGVNGRHVTINGVRWRPHTWNSLNLRLGDEAALREYFRWNDRGVRMEGGLHAAFLDRHGIPGRLSMCFEGMFGQVAMNNPRTWANWKLHVEQMVRAYRNSPSVVHWSVGNEVMMITGRLFFAGEIARHERLMADVMAVAKRLDPTRTVSEDGAGDVGGLGDSNNWHYVTGDYKVPRQFYAYDIGPLLPGRDTQDMQKLYRWDGARPLVQGEEMYFPGMGNFAWFGGPAVYRGQEQRAEAGGRYGRMYIEGARWQDVFLCNPCTGPLPGVEIAMSARAVFVRECNSTFYPGATLTRAIKVFNDTRTDQTLTLRWRLLAGDAVLGEGSKDYALKAGENQEDSLTTALPTAEQRVDARLVLELRAGKTPVFEDAKPITILPLLPPTPTRPDELVVFDPGGRVAEWLTKAGQTMTVLPGLDALPAAARVVLVGPDAITPENRAAVAAALRGHVTGGGVAIVLEQSTPLREGDLPVGGIVLADRERGKAARPEWEKVGGHTGAIAHPMALAHPALAGLKPADFFTWAGEDQLNYRLSYATPPSGSINLVQAGEDLTLAPMFELLIGRGSYLLSQMLIGEKLQTDPAAARLLQNSIAWAVARGATPTAKTVVVAGGDEAFAGYVRSLGIDHEAGDLDAALRDDVDVAVVRATPEALRALAGGAARAFAERGGWLMLVGVDGDGLESFNALVGVPHRLRPFRHEAVRLEAMDDALAMGISDRDLQQIDPEVIAPWMGLHRVSGRLFSGVVDAGAEIASFAELSAFSEGEGRPLTDGLLSDTFWRYTQYVSSTGSEPVTLRFDRPEAIRAIRLASSGAYVWAREIEVLLDEQPALRFTLRQEAGFQEIALPAKPATSVGVRLLSTYPAGPDVSQPLVTLDEMQVIRDLPEAFAGRVVPLTTPGGIVKYPIGRGGIVLNQARYDGDDLPENLAKKRILHSSLLRNMGCTFRQ